MKNANVIILRIYITFTILFFISQSQMILPDNYNLKDDYYADDLKDEPKNTNIENQEFRQVIFAHSSKVGYLDMYHGIYYLPKLKCGYYGSIVTTPKNLKFQNQETNLKQLYDYGCRGHLFYNNISLYHVREVESNQDPIFYRAIIRISNPSATESILYSLKLCEKEIVRTPPYKECGGAIALEDQATIEAGEIKTITLVWDSNGNYYSEYTNKDPNEKLLYNAKPKTEINITEYFVLYFILDNKETDTDRFLYIHSVLLIADLRKEIRATTGSLFNFCTNRGCFNNYECNVKTFICEKYWISYYEYIDCSLKGCIDNTFCENSKKICTQCDLQCRSCGSTAKNSCQSCFRNAVKGQFSEYESSLQNGARCKYEFNSLSNIGDIDIDIPIPLSYRLTIEFWVFIHDPTHLIDKELQNSLSSFIFKDLATFSLQKNENTDGAIDFIVTPFEMYFPFTKNILNVNDYATELKNKYNGAGFTFVSDTLSEVTSKWIFIRAGISYNHKEIFSIKVAKSLEPIPIFVVNNTILQTTYGTLFRKFHRLGDKSTLRIQGYAYVDTEIYLRNLNIFSEYIKTDPYTKNYFNFHKLTSIIDHPQLMFSIPFDDGEYDSSYYTVKFNVYDFSGQFFETKNNNVIKTQLTFSWLRNKINPSKNFRRLNFLDINKKYINTDLSATGNIENNDCNAINKKYCGVKDNHYEPFVCSNNSNLDINTPNSCITYCSTINKHRLPNIKTNQDSSGIQNNICTSECKDGINDNCSLENFSCKAPYIPLFYSCFQPGNPPEKSGLQFSGTLGTKSIEFPLDEVSDFLIEIWFHPDLLYQRNPPLYTSHIFMTNKHEVYYDVSSKLFEVRVVGEGGMENNFPLGQNIYYYGWNHFILSNVYDANAGTTKIKASISNLFVDIGNVDGPVSIKKICFCNRDENCCSMKSNVLWFDLFITDIKVWSSSCVNAYTLIDYNKLSNYNIEGLLYWYPLDLTNLDKNEIKEKVSNNKVVSFPSDNKYLNPDKDMNFNYGWNFNFNDIYKPSEPIFVSKTTILNSNKVKIEEFEKCAPECIKCFGETKYTCYECQDGYSLSGSTCTRPSDDNPTYYYLNPPLDPSKSLKLNLNDIVQNLNSLTIFFYMKLYGFIKGVNSNIDIITFSSTTKLIYKNDDTTSLVLTHDGKELFAYQNFREHFGLWVPISISAFRADETLNLQKHMITMTVNFTPLSYILGEANYEKLILTEFTINNKVIGHFAYITYSKRFIINAYGYKSHLHSRNINSIFSNSNDNYLLKVYLKPQAQSTSFTNTNDLLSINSNELSTLKWVEDYLSYSDQSCGDDEFVDIMTQNLPAYCVPNPSKCENIQQTIQVMSNCDYLYATCDNISRHSIYNLIFKYTPVNSNDHYIICGKSNTLDMARYQKGILDNIQIPDPAGLKLEFWFLTQSYVSINNGRFKFIANWDKLIKIEVGFENNKFYAKCNVLNDNGNGKTFRYPDNEENKWRYVVCGYNSTTNTYYVTNLQKENYVTSPIGGNYPTESTTSLILSEESETNYGVTYIREMRLWNCSDCFSDKAFIPYDRDDRSFTQVIHYFQFEDPTGHIADKRYRDNKDTSIIPEVTLIEKNLFNGYGLLDKIPDPPNCNEGGSSYFSIKTGRGCDTMFNFNIFNSDVVFDKIPSSKSNKYTMEFWFFIESGNDFINGTNIIYEDHMAMSLKKSSLNDNDISIYCFPQAYRDKIKDMKAEEIEDVYNKAQNAIKATYSDGFGKWNYARCAYSYDIQKYYLNDENVKDVIPERFYANTGNERSNAFSFKYFMNNYVKLIINGAIKNFTRIIIQVINLYRDYIPKEIILKHLSMKYYANSVTESEYSILTFSVDFENDYDIVRNRLKYYITDYETGNNNPDLYIPRFMTNVTPKTYPNYPVYDEFELCPVGKYYDDNHKCSFITNPSNCNSKNVFCCDNNNKFFWCPKGQYLNIQTLQCDTSCPDGYTRPPDMINQNGLSGMCYINKNELHYSQYPSTSTQLSQGENHYEDNFQCASGYTLVNYHCVSNSLIEGSAIYFSTKYKYNNMIANYAKLKLLNYFVDFWFMFDNIETYRFKQSETDNKGNVKCKDERKYIFIAYPHFISRHCEKIEYNNSFINLQTFQINNIKKYNWNRIVIENHVIKGKSLAETAQYINVYVNNNFVTPEVAIKVSRLDDFSLAQIAFCHKENSEYSYCNLGLNSTTYKVYSPLWEDAFYRDIVVWDWETTGYSSINTFGTELNKEITMNIVSYHPMTINTIKKNIIESKAYYKGQYYHFESRPNNDIEYDKSTSVNWVTGFDVTLPNYSLENVVSDYIDDKQTPPFGITEANYETEECSGKCKRCFSLESDKCISCKDGLILSGTKCVEYTGYYFATPTSNSGNLKKIKLYTFDSNVKEMTITFYMKFFGTTAGLTGISPIVYFNDEDNFFGWDNDHNSFCVIINYSSLNNRKTVYSYENSRISIGKWSLYSISIAQSKYIGIFPHMIQLMIDRNHIELSTEFKPIASTTLINFNTITLSNMISCIYFDMRIYNKFYIGAYSLGQNPNERPTPSFILKSNSLTAFSNCIEVTGLNLGATYCTFDDNPYDDNTLYCSGNNVYRDIDTISRSVKCVTCDAYCLTNCYNEGNKGCMCTHDDSKYLIRNVNESYYCEKPTSLNVNEYNEITVNNISPGSSSSYMIEMWVFIMIYISNNNFVSIDVTWKNFAQVKLLPNGEKIKVKCYPYSEDTSFSIENEIEYKKWNFIRCLIDKDIKTVSLNSQKSTINIAIPTFPSNTILTIKDGNINPYGISLLRELRLWNEKNNLFYDTERLNLATDHTYTNLVHYFKNIYTTDNRDFIYDEKTKKSTEITRKIPGGIYPYSYINESLTELILCDEGYVYKFNPLSGKDECSLYGSEDILNNLEDDNKVYQPKDLLSKITVIYETALNDYSKPSSIGEIDTIVNVDSDGIKKTDPIITNAYCSNKGYAKIVDRTLVCYCFSAYVGKYCQLKNEDYSNLDKIYESLLLKAKQTFEEFYGKGIQEDDKQILSSLSNLIKGSRLYSIDNNFLTQISKWMNTNVVYQIKTCDEEIIKLENELYSNYVTLLNYYKVGMLSNGNVGTTDRNAQLNYLQRQELEEIVELIKSHLEYLTSQCFINLNQSNIYWNYKSDNLNVDLVQLYKSSSSFDLEEYFKEIKLEKYLPYFSISECSEEIFSNGNIINLQFITWFNCPYAYNPNLYWNYTSSYLMVKLYNEEISQLPIDKCKDDGKIIFYLSVYNPIMVDVINKNKFHFIKENVYETNDPIFTEPKYIESNGHIQNTTREERIEKYYFEYILKFYSLDAKTMEYTNEGVEYLNITNDNYLKCSSSHLSEFLLNFLFNEFPSKIDGRLYFLKHFNLFTNKENYANNYGFFLIVGVIFMYILNFIICFFKLRSKLRRVNNKRYKLIEEYLKEYCFPYGNYEGEYVFKRDNGRKIFNEDSFHQEDKNKINEKINKKFDKEGNIYFKEKEEFLHLNKGPNGAISTVVGNIVDKQKFTNYFRHMAEDVIVPENDVRCYVTKDEIIKKENDEYLRKINTKRKESKKKNTNKHNNNFIVSKKHSDSDDKVNDENEEEEEEEEEENGNKEYCFDEEDEKEQKNYIHNLKIYNEGMRTKLLSKITLHPCKFLGFNIKNRNLFICSFIENVTYTAPTKALYFPMYLAIVIFVNTMIYLFQDKIEYNNLFSKHLVKFIIFAVVSILLANIYFYIKSLAYYVYKSDVRDLYYKFKTSKKKFDPKYTSILKRIRISWIIETILFVIFVGISFIFSFGLCAVYNEQGKCMMMSVAFGVAGDFVLSLIGEFMIMMLFLCRKNHILVVVLDYVNRMKSFKVIAP